jgi:hypothetical protein
MAARNNWSHKFAQLVLVLIFYGALTEERLVEDND